MDQDRIAGSIRQVAGSVRQMIGKLPGDRKIALRGRADIAAGKVQNAVGGLKDTAREIVGKE